MALEYEFIGRTKPIKGHAYPIKRGDLDIALEQAGVTELEDVNYISTKQSDPHEIRVLSVFMMGEAKHVGMWMKKAPSLMVNTVPVEVAQEVKAAIAQNDLLKILANWLRKLELAENVRRDQSQHFNVCYTDGKLAINKTE